MKKYTYWVVRPQDTLLEPLERSTQWGLSDIYETIGDGCQMMQIIRLAPYLPSVVNLQPPVKAKAWQAFAKENCMIVDEEFLVKERIPAPNFIATMMRMEPIHGVAIVTPWSSID